MKKILGLLFAVVALCACNETPNQKETDNSKFTVAAKIPAMSNALTINGAQAEYYNSAFTIVGDSNPDNDYMMTFFVNKMSSADDYRGWEPDSGFDQNRLDLLVWSGTVLGKTFDLMSADNLSSEIQCEIYLTHSQIAERIAYATHKAAPYHSSTNIAKADITFYKGEAANEYAVVLHIVTLDGEALEFSYHGQMMQSPHQFFWA